MNRILFCSSSYFCIKTKHFRGITNSIDFLLGTNPMALTLSFGTSSSVSFEFVDNFGFQRNYNKASKTALTSLINTGAKVGTCDASGGPRTATKSCNMLRFSITTFIRDDLDKAPPPFRMDEEVESVAAVLEEFAPTPLPVFDFTPPTPPFWLTAEVTGTASTTRFALNTSKKKCFQELLVYSKL